MSKQQNEKEINGMIKRVNNTLSPKGLRLEIRYSTPLYYLEIYSPKKEQGPQFIDEFIKCVKIGKMDLIHSFLDGMIEGLERVPLMGIPAETDVIIHVVDNEVKNVYANNALHYAVVYSDPTNYSNLENPIVWTPDHVSPTDVDMVNPLETVKTLGGYK